MAADLGADERGSEDCTEDFDEESTADELRDDEACALEDGTGAADEDAAGADEEAASFELTSDDEACFSLIACEDASDCEGCERTVPVPCANAAGTIPAKRQNVVTPIINLVERMEGV